MQTRPPLGVKPPWQPVGRIEDLEFLVKECEVLTGRSGRRFVIASTDRLYYQAHWRSPALVIDRVDRHGAVCDRQFLRGPVLTRFIAEWTMASLIESVFGRGPSRSLLDDLLIAACLARRTAAGTAAGPGPCSPSPAPGPPAGSSKSAGCSGCAW